ncbi:MAG: hypothetical protein OSA22_02750 [Aquiluna sp.]|nr:hypothetical protein [Aquiluna sp.]
MTKVEFTVDCEEEQSGGWRARVSNPECEAHARRLDKLKKGIAQSIHQETGVELCEIVVRLQGVFPEAVSSFESAHVKIEQANQLRDKAAQEIRQIVASLRAEGLTMRDIAALLDISPQRVGQLAQSSQTPLEGEAG